MPNIRVIGSAGNAALILEWVDGSVTKTALVLRYELTETRNPTVADDSGQGFERGSFWFNAGTLTAFICLNPAAGNAQWRQMAGGGGGTGTSVGIVVEVSSNITIDGTGALPTIDGYAVQDGDRVLLTAQTSADENGLWIAHTIATAWVRPTDFASGDHAGGRIVFVVKGTAFPDTLWACITDPPNDVIDTDNLAFEQIGKRAEVQIIYVGKHGSDSNAGKSIEDAKLTFGSAITAAGTPASEATAVTIVCLDDGRYDEDLTHVGFVYVYAPNATIEGYHILASGVHRLVARRLVGTGAFITLNIQAGADEVYVDAERIESPGSPLYPISVGGGGPLYLKADSIDTTGAINNGGISVGGGSVAHIDVLDFFVRDKEALRIFADGEIYGRVGRLHGLTGSTGLSVSGAGTGVMRLQVGEISCPTAWNINQANADVKVFCNHITGTRTETAGKIRIVEAIKHNLHGTSADPTVNDDNLKGYSIGSRWINTTADKLFTCLDASTGAAIWALGNSPRVIRTTDDIKAILEAATDGQSFWLEDGTHTIADKITISSVKDVSIRGTRSAIVTQNTWSDLFRIEGCTNFVMEGFTLLAPADYGEMIAIVKAASGSYQLPLRHRYSHLHLETPIGSGNEVVGFISNSNFIDSTIEFCEIFGRFGAGIDIFAAGIGENVEGCIIRGNRIVTDIAGTLGIEIASKVGTGIIVEGNTIRGAFDAGIILYDAEDVLVRNNFIEGSGSEGIDVQSLSNKASIIGNHIKGVGGNGIKVAASSVTVTENVVDSAVGDGIKLEAAATQALVADNNLIANGGYGINTDTASADCSFEANHYNGNTSGTLNLQGTNEHTVNGKTNNRLPTVDATVTTIATVAIPDDTAVWIEVNVINRRTNAADRGKWKRGALVYREAAGAATLEGSVWTPLTIKSVVPAVWDCTITVSGNNALVQVTGAVGHDLNWESRHTVEERS